MFLYQVCKAFELAEDEQSRRDVYWFPMCYIYAKNVPVEWGKMKSRRYCEKIKVLFGADSLERLKDIVGKCTFDSEMKYSGRWNAAPTILNCIKVEEIGTLN